MNESTGKVRALALSLVVVLSVLAATTAFTGAVAGATNVSISPDDNDAGAGNVAYTSEGNVELANQDTLQYVDVHLGPADVSAVGEGDVDVFVDGNEYTDGLTQFSASNGTVEFKLSNSQSVSDTDPVRIVVADVTNPSDDFGANTTLHDSGDDQWQEFTDTVSIDTPANISYSDLGFADSRSGGNDTTINAGENLNVSATVNNSGEQNGTYNASLEVDGGVQQFNNGTIEGESNTTTSFVTNFSSPGEYNVTIGNLSTTEVTVTGPLGIADGSADPSTVDAGTTVSNQKVYVDVANVSQDGDTDVHYVEFPNALAGNLSVNSASANATSVTSSPNLVDGYDNDGTVDTVRFATSGDGGGDIALNLTVDVDVDYPDENRTYGIDARTTDSGGETATQSDVANVSAEGASGGDTGGTDGDTGGTDGDTGGTDGDTGGEADSDGSDGDGDDRVPSVRHFGLTVEGQDVDVTVTVTAPVDELRVDISGPVETELTRSDFTRLRQYSAYVYAANVSTTKTGTFDATLEVAANDNGNGASNETSSVTVGSADSVEASVVAAPPWTGESESVHTVTMPVSDDSGVASETLDAVVIGYSDEFLDAGGSVSSVSDDQNVATLQVLTASGRVKSTMGDTDAVAVNVVSGEVRLDLSDVDSSRRPTLASGDRVVVRIRPVTNPETAGHYDADVTLRSAAGHSDTASPAVHIRDRTDAMAVATEFVEPADEKVSLDLPNSRAVKAVRIASEANTSGSVRVVVPDDRPPVADDAPGSVITTMNVSRPAPVENTSATLTVTLSTEAFAGDASDLAMARYDASADGWERLDTEVVSRSDGEVTIEATTSRTSLFAVTSTGDTGEQQTEATPTSDENTPRSTPTDVEETPTPTGVPGFGVSVSVVALLGAALLALGRRDDR